MHIIARSVLPCNDVALFFFRANRSLYRAEYHLGYVAGCRSQNIRGGMGVEHERRLVIGILYVLRGIEAQAGKYGVGYGDGQCVEKVHLELISRDPFQHTASGSCFEP